MIGTSMLVDDIKDMFGTDGLSVPSYASDILRQRTSGTSSWNIRGR